MDLSKRRAPAVKQALVGRYKIDDSHADVAPRSLERLRAPADRGRTR
jgi:outer membrane protein OmpA-like peptidoglycan-associated protein